MGLQMQRTIQSSTRDTRLTAVSECYFNTWTYMCACAPIPARASRQVSYSTATHTSRPSPRGSNALVSAARRPHVLPEPAARYNSFKRPEVLSVARELPEAWLSSKTSVRASQI
jgi:hypothetical protein